MMGLKKNLKIEDLEKRELEHYHDNLHVEWNKISKGETSDWTLIELYNTHQKVIWEMKTNGVKHVAPIDKLDSLRSEFFLSEEFSHIHRQSDGESEGELLKLDEVLPHFKDFMISVPAVYLVGGLTNHGETQGDIDILFKVPYKYHDDPWVRIMMFRIQRALPKKYWERLHWLFDDDSAGPFTNYIPLYKLKAEINSRQIFKMAQQDVALTLSASEEAAKSRKQDRIIPFRYFVQPKPVHGREKSEIYSFESLKETISGMKKWMEQLPKGIYVEKKFDGVRCQAHKVGNKVKIMTEEGRDITHTIPSLVKQFSSIKADFIATFEAELWLKGKHENRADTAGVLNRVKPTPDEQYILSNIYDCLWYNGKDIHKYPYSARLNFMKKIPDSENIKKSKQSIAKNFNSLKRLTNRFSLTKGSEGAMFKLPSYHYRLDGKSYEMMKFKKERSIVAKVLIKHRVKGTTKTYYYRCAIQGDTYVGKTFNTNIDAPVGSKLEVVFVDLNQWTDPKTKEVFFTWWSPRVVGKSMKSITSITAAKKLVEETSGQVGTKSIPSIPKVPEGDSESLAELSFKKRFVFQNHYRGKSVHADLRFERNGNLEGYTLMHQVEGEIKEPVTTIKDANIQDIHDANFKINLKTGEVKEERKIEVITKSTQPKVWLDIAPGISLSGMEAGVGKRPEPGATAKFPGVFTKIDSGTYEEGARKPYYYEYFIDGKVFKGRYIFRQLGAERIKGREARKPFVWFFWKPEDQTPYVLSARGISKKYVPEKGRSALPAEWEKKIPERLRWWKRGVTGEKALAMMKEIRKLLITRKEKLAETKFKLKHDWWKGQFVIRGMPVEHWSIKFDVEGWPYFSLDKNPLTVESGITGIRKKGSQALFDMEGIIPAGKPPNPNKKIPMHIDDIDEGSANILEDSENFMHVNFKGKKLKGHWVFKRTDPASNIWLMSKGEIPKPSKLSHEFGEPLTKKEINVVFLLSRGGESPSSIARLIDRPVRTVYDWISKFS